MGRRAGLDCCLFWGTVGWPFGCLRVDAGSAFGIRLVVEGDGAAQPGGAAGTCLSCRVLLRRI